MNKIAVIFNQDEFGETFIYYGVKLEQVVRKFVEEMIFQTMKENGYTPENFDLPIEDIKFKDIETTKELILKYYEKYLPEVLENKEIDDQYNSDFEIFANQLNFKIIDIL